METVQLRKSIVSNDQSKSSIPPCVARQERARVLLAFLSLPPSKACSIGNDFCIIGTQPHFFCVEIYSFLLSLIQIIPLGKKGGSENALI